MFLEPGVAETDEVPVPGRRGHSHTQHHVCRVELEGRRVPGHALGNDSSLFDSIELGESRFRQMCDIWGGTFVSREAELQKKPQGPARVSQPSPSPAAHAHLQPPENISPFMTWLSSHWKKNNFLPFLITFTVLQ